MKKLFYEVNSLDKKCYEEFALTEDILMEHASSSMATYIEKNFSENQKVLIVCGVGNNGADGIALARLLFKKFDVSLYLPFAVKSNMAELQLKRVNLLGVKIIDELLDYDIVVDCLFGSGLNKDLNEESQELIEKLNCIEAFKIACDIPSGINSLGEITTIAFKSDITITMGALKVALFSDMAKDYVGEIIVANLGVQREVYENVSNLYLLEQSDLKLPFRDKKDSHKGSFGHVAIIVGEKEGAAKISCDAAFSFGAGLVTAVSHLKVSLPYNIMQSHFIPKNTTAIAIGMGLGNFEQREVKEILSLDVKKVVDADLFYEEVVLNALDENSVLTPHPKEFCSLLKLANICDIDIKELQSNRFKYVDLFMKEFPKSTLLLKGANVIIANGDRRYVNSLGNAVLSKGGSGDVLSGLIASLLAQGYSCIDSAICASLAHSIAGNNYSKNNYSLKPQDLIDEVTKL